MDVAFKFDIDVLLLFINNILFVDKLFKLLNIVVLVVFMFGMSKYVCVDILVKFVFINAVERFKIRRYWIIVILII